MKINPIFFLSNLKQFIIGRDIIKILKITDKNYHSLLFKILKTVDFQQNSMTLRLHSILSS